MPDGVGGGTSPHSPLVAELDPRLIDQKLARLRETAQFVNQDALGSPQEYWKRAGMLHAVREG
jgi:hypothetical protein